MWENDEMSPLPSMPFISFSFLALGSASPLGLCASTTDHTHERTRITAGRERASKGELEGGGWLQGPHGKIGSVHAQSVLLKACAFPSLEVRGSAWETGNTSVEETGRASHSHGRGTRGDVKQCVVHAVHVMLE